MFFEKSYVVNGSLHNCFFLLGCAFECCIGLQIRATFRAFNYGMTFALNKQPLFVPVHIFCDKNIEGF